MKNRYELTFEKLKQQGRKAFIPFTMLGYPEKEKSFEAIRIMIENGASALELGLAFSDPLADGPVIQEAAALTIESGFKTRDAFELIERARELSREIPICLMCYFNSMMAVGIEEFCHKAKGAGVDALLVLDLPPDESGKIKDELNKNGLLQVFIISPLSSSERLEQIGSMAGGFLYVVSRLGTTGIEERYDEQLQSLLSRAKELSKLPLAVGFGISTPEQAAKMYALGADAAISGSAIIEIIKRDKDGQLSELATFIQSMANADLHLPH